MNYIFISKWFYYIASFLHGGKTKFWLLFLHVDKRLFEMLTIDYIIKTAILSWRVYKKKCHCHNNIDSIILKDVY